MNWQGWTLMIVSVSATTFSLAWCLWQILREPATTQHIHSQVDIDTKDREE